MSIEFQLRARPEYREPRPNFEAKEPQAQPLRRPNFDYVNVKPRQHHDQEVKYLPYICKFRTFEVFKPYRMLNRFIVVVVVFFSFFLD